MEAGVLRFTSCQANIAESFCKSLTAYMRDRLHIPTEFVGHVPWKERERLLDRGQVHVCWICGLPYSRKSGNGTIELLAAPVMVVPRYKGKPVYYSDVVVRTDGPFRSFEDLRGRAWAYNEPGSHSGYNLVRYHMAANGTPAGFFSRVVESGAHQESLRMILDGRIDGAAIDSTVLEMAFKQDPSLRPKFRTIAVLGPSPAPPWVVHRIVPVEVRTALRREFFKMDTDQEGRRILEESGFLRFVHVDDRDYDPIREMDKVAAAVRW
jgi:phosphonate transport system substrate-binding protein